MKTKKLSRATIEVEFQLPKSGEQWFLLSADRHWDNPKSDHRLQIKHMEEARNRKAKIIDFGDLFCAMQGKYDPRSSKKDLRPEHQTDAYLDSLVSTATDFFEPYADLFLTIGTGNHESSIQKRSETDLTARLVERLNDRGKTNIARMGFSYWVVFRMRTHGQEVVTKRLYLHHGYGGDAPVTKGTIQTNRMAVYLPDADFVATGHTHNRWIFPIERFRVNNQGRTYFDTQTHVKTATYKEEFTDGFGGWHVERGAPPKPVGAIWMRIYRDTDVENTTQIKSDFTFAT